MAPIRACRVAVVRLSVLFAADGGALMIVEAKGVIKLKDVNDDGKITYRILDINLYGEDVIELSCGHRVEWPADTEMFDYCLFCGKKVRKNA